VGRVGQVCFGGGSEVGRTAQGQRKKQHHISHDAAFA